MNFINSCHPVSSSHYQILQSECNFACCVFEKIYNDMFPTIKVEDRVSSLHWLILHPFLPQQLATTDLYHCLLSFTFFRMSFDLNYIIFSNCLLSQNFLLSLSNMLINSSVFSWYDGTFIFSSK